jgi:hypothetical protein
MLHNSLLKQKWKKNILLNIYYILYGHYSSKTDLIDIQAQAWCQRPNTLRVVEHEK